MHSLDGTSHNITVSIQGSDDGPVLDIALLNQSVGQGSDFNFEVPANAFSNLDGDALSYSASLADGSSLPDWLNFDASTGTFSGTPDSVIRGRYRLPSAPAMARPAPTQPLP